MLIVIGFNSDGAVSNSVSRIIRHLLWVWFWFCDIRLKTARAIIAIGGVMIVVIEIAIAECLFYVYKYD